jgi:hypothetical protein
MNEPDSSRLQNVTDPKWDEQPADPVWNAATMSLPAFAVVAAVLATIVVTCVVMASWGCVRADTPIALKTPIASTTKETTVTQNESPGATGGDKLSLTGGGTDSIALWLAIVSLGLAPVTAVAGAKVYEGILRPRRLVKENGKAPNGK